MGEQVLPTKSQRKYLIKRNMMKTRRKLLKIIKKKRDLERVRALLAEENYTSKRLLKKSLANKMAAAFKSGIKICIDCAFESYMSLKECNKFAQQLCRAYGANRKHACPVSLHLVNFEPSGVLADACRAKCDGFDKYQLGMHTEPARKVFSDHKEIIYLSPDAKDPLLSLSDDTVYVIGGMVDEHLMKGRSLQEAETQQCRAARLPIPEFIDLVGSRSPDPVLTINQVIELILDYLNNGRDWKKAILSAVPKRLIIH